MNDKQLERECKYCKKYCNRHRIRLVISSLLEEGFGDHRPKKRVATYTSG
jgi:hypothetical protein